MAAANVLADEVRSFICFGFHSRKKNIIRFALVHSLFRVALILVSTEDMWKMGFVRRPTRLVLVNASQSWCCLDALLAVSPTML